MVLCNEQDLPMADRVVDAAGQLGEVVLPAVVVHRMCRVQPQAVQVVLVHPVQSILGQELSDLEGMVTVEIDPGAPWALVTRREVVRAERVEVRTVWAHVVVDHVEQHGESDPVCSIDETAEVLRRAVAARRREQRDAVVAPVARSRKVANRHQLDRGHTERPQVRKALLDTGERTLGTERADVQLVDDQIGHRAS